MCIPITKPCIGFCYKNVCVFTAVAPNASINGLTTAQVAAAAGDDVTFTCLVRGFPEPNISITLSGVNAPYTIGNQTLMTEATPTSAMEVTRTVTLHNVTAVDYGAVVTCVGSNMNNGSTHTHQTTATLLVGGEMDGMYGKSWDNAIIIWYVFVPMCKCKVIYCM